MIGTTVAAFFFGANFSNGMLIVSLFFAFARFYPEEVIYILFILPMKIKWMAWIMGAFLLLGFVVNGMSYRMALVAAFANYLIFFGPEIIHEARHRTEVSARRKRFESHITERSRAAPQLRSLRRDRVDRSESGLPRRARRRGILHGAFAESGTPAQ